MIFTRFSVCVAPEFSFIFEPFGLFAINVAALLFFGMISSIIL